MPSVKIDSWTKNKLDEILVSEGHNSHDSVIKRLLTKHQILEELHYPDRHNSMHEQIKINSYLHSQEKITDYQDSRTEQLVTKATDTAGEPSKEKETIQKPIQGLTVFAEKTTHEHGKNNYDLVCPNCASTVITINSTVPSQTCLEGVTCPGCGIQNHNDLTLVVKEPNSSQENNYPEQKTQDQETYKRDLKHCVLDYWNRYFETKYYSIDEDFTPEDEELAEDLYRVARKAGWSWRPPDLPVQELRIENFYKIPPDTYLQLLEPLEGTEVRVTKWLVGDDPFDSEPEEMSARELHRLTRQDEIMRTFELECLWEVVNVIRLMTYREDRPITVDRIVEKAGEKGVPPRETRRVLEDLEEEQHRGSNTDYSGLK